MSESLPQIAQMTLATTHTAEMVRFYDALFSTRFQAVEARSSVRERLRGEGLDARLGGIDRFTSVADAVDAFQKQITT